MSHVSGWMDLVLSSTRVAGRGGQVVTRVPAGRPFATMHAASMKASMKVLPRAAAWSAHPRRSAIEPRRGSVAPLMAPSTRSGTGHGRRGRGCAEGVTMATATASHRRQDVNGRDDDVGDAGGGAASVVGAVTAERRRPGSRRASSVTTAAGSGSGAAPTLVTVTTALAALAAARVACPEAAAASESLTDLIGTGDDAANILQQLLDYLDYLETLPRVETVPYWLAVLTVSEMVPLLPTQPMALTSGILFGAWEGSAVILAGYVSAATFSYLIAGGVGRSFAEKIIEEETGEKMSFDEDGGEEPRRRERNRQGG